MHRFYLPNHSPLALGEGSTALSAVAREQSGVGDWGIGVGERMLGSVAA